MNMGILANRRIFEDVDVGFFAVALGGDCNGISILFFFVQLTRSCVTDKKTILLAFINFVFLFENEIDMKVPEVRPVKKLFRISLFLSF